MYRFIDYLRITYEVFNIYQFKFIFLTGCDINCTLGGSCGSGNSDDKKDVKNSGANKNKEETQVESNTCSSKSVEYSETVLPIGTRGASTAIVTCTEGYTKTGDAFEWTCNTDGEWTGEACVSTFDCDIKVDNSEMGIYGLFNDETVYVKCNESHKGSRFVTCTDGAPDATPVCESYTKSTVSSPLFNEDYSQQGFHCDLNDDDIVDAGELIDFPDHSFVMKVKHLGGRFTIPVQLKDYPGDNPEYDDSHDTNFYVDWGNGKCSHITNASSVGVAGDNSMDYSLTPSADEVVTVRVTGVLDNLAPDDSLRFFFKGDFVEEVVELGSVGWKSLGKAFYFHESLQRFSANHTDTSKVINFRDTFGMASNLLELDLRNFDTSLGVDFNSMFIGLEKLKYLDISSFDTSNGENFNLMFYNLIELNKLDVSHFNFSKAKRLNGFISFNQLLTSIALEYVDLRSFNFSNFSTPIDDLFPFEMNGAIWIPSGIENGQVTVNLGSYSTLGVIGMANSDPEGFEDDMSSVINIYDNVTIICESDDDPLTPGNEIYFNEQYNACEAP